MRLRAAGAFSRGTTRGHVTLPPHQGHVAIQVMFSIPKSFIKISLSLSAETYYCHCHPSSQYVAWRWDTYWRDSRRRAPGSSRLSAVKLHELYQVIRENYLFRALRCVDAALMATTDGAALRGPGVDGTGKPLGWRCPRPARNSASALGGTGAVWQYCVVALLFFTKIFRPPKHVLSSPPSSEFCGPRVSPRFES